MDSIYEKIFLREENLSHTELANMKEHGLCYSALLYASDRKIADAQKTLKQLNDGHSEHMCSIVAEVNSLLSFYMREFSAAKDFALKAIELSPESLIAYSVLARIAMFEKKYPMAIQYHQRILKVFPGNDKTILNMAETLILSKDVKTARKHLEEAKPSARKRLYNFFLVSMNLMARLLWLIAVFTMLVVNQLLFISFYILTTVGLVYIYSEWGIKRGDLVLLRFSTYFQLLHTFLFFLAICALLDKFF